MKLLHLDSSILSENSVSRELTRALVDQWRSTEAGIDIVCRDLALHAPAHLSAAVMRAAALPVTQRSEEQHAELALSETLLAEFLEADVLVIGAPMYNFSIPSQLKAWLDRVMVAGRTFKYTDTGPVGLAGNKRTFIVVTRGGVYAPGSAAHQLEHQESYLKAALGFMGIRDITVIHAEGVSMQEKRDAAIAAAHKQIQVLLRAAA